MNKFFSNKTDYNPNVNYDTLDQHTYADSGENVFFTCPRCKKQFLASFMFESFHPSTETSSNLKQWLQNTVCFHNRHWLQ